MVAGTWSDSKAVPEAAGNEEAGDRRNLGYDRDAIRCHVDQPRPFLDCNGSAKGREAADQVLETFV
jgi:hypothetical protein